MKKRNKSLLAGIILTTGLTASLLMGGCTGEIKETRIYGDNYKEIGELNIYKRTSNNIPDSYKITFKAPDNKLDFEVVIPKHPDSKFTMTDQHGHNYVLDLKNDYGLKINPQKEVSGGEK